MYCESTLIPIYDMIVTPELHFFQQSPCTKGYLTQHRKPHPTPETSNKQGLACITTIFLLKSETLLFFTWYSGTSKRLGTYPTLVPCSPHPSSIYITWCFFTRLKFQKNFSLMFWFRYKSEVEHAIHENGKKDKNAQSQNC